MPSKQIPIGSGFDATATAEQVLTGVDLSGKTAIVTGGYSGLGLETTRVLANAGATVIVAARDLNRANFALANIPRIRIGELDLLDATSIDAFATKTVGSGQPVHMLINNGGFMAAPLARDIRGNESHFSANHLGHFQLTARLWSALRLAKGARVVSVSSRAHRLCPIDFDDTKFERREYDKVIAYAQSKTAQSLFSVGLDVRGEQHGIRAFALHPGSIITDLARHLSDDEMNAFGVSRYEPNRFPVGQSVEEGGDHRSVAQGAATSVWCATSAQLNGMGGVYCENTNIAEITSADVPFRAGVCHWAVDHEIAERLWAMSETLTGATLS